MPLKICRILNKPSRNSQRLIKIVPQWRNFAKFGQLVMIGDTYKANYVKAILPPIHPMCSDRKA